MDNTMTGVYHIVLRPDADEQAFVKHMTDVVFEDPNALQPTRITRSFAHQLLKAQGSLPRYSWQTTVDLETDAGYDFERNAGTVQKHVESFGLLVGIDAYTHEAPSI